MERQCPCGLTVSYDVCCGSYHHERVLPETAEKLMRSRYSAYVLELIDYLVKTTHPSTAKRVNIDAIRDWAHQASWQGLEVVRSTQGGSSDKIGKVEFKATYSLNGETQTHHELSRFKRYKGKWYYLDGIVY